VDAAEIDPLLAIEQDVGPRVRDILEQLLIERRSARERVLDVLAELVHVLLLDLRPHELCGRRKRRAAQRMLRMVVRRRDVQLGVLAHLGDLTQDRLAVARSQPGVDNHRRAAADDDPDIGDHRHVAVRNRVDVLRHFDRRVFLDERRRRGRRRLTERA
jgi:hypothetical protein